MTLKSSLVPHLPHSPGVYLMRDNTGGIIYIGKAIDLKKRVASYFNRSINDPTGKTSALISEIRHIDYVPTSSEREALVLERRLIKRYKPVFNVMWKDDKSYPYIALTMNEDFPRVFLTRRKKRDGSLYFGPYPSVKRVRNLLRWAWRKKIFPLRPCDYEFDEKNTLPYKKVKSCLYLHTGECTAPCIGKITSKKYRKIAQRAKWFLEGKTDRLEKLWNKEMRTFSKNREFEKAGLLRDQIQTIQYLQDNVTFREMSETMLQGKILESRRVMELKKALNLPHPPQRIECFDISHVQGSEKVASMVSFYQGRPDKAQYRKYLIKTVQGIDDFKSMGEVVSRRYKRLLDESLPLPDLILIDGGKGQLGAAQKSLLKIGVKNVPLAALAKAEEEIFVPLRPHPLRLPIDSPALLLLRQIRDEAHRFALKFHRLRRKKGALKGKT